ncbi:MAG TPA: rhodanese-like domain-containing protein [Bacteroidia bacterium]|nr:rhodanese-like domain-containing protein [Bacteroidia bacterium]
MENLEQLIKSGKATIVDVRTPAEFMGGHVAGSINIPLQEIPQRLTEFKKMQHIVLCCASGGRSAQATSFLKQNKINCEDGGSWLSVNAYC